MALLQQSDLLRYLRMGPPGVWVQYEVFAFYKDPGSRLWTILDCEQAWVWWEVPDEWASRIMQVGWQIRPTTTAKNYNGFWGQSRPDSRQWCQSIMASAVSIDVWIRDGRQQGGTSGGNQIQQGGQVAAQTPCDCRTQGDYRVPVGPAPLLPASTGGGQTGGKYATPGPRIG